MITIYVLPDWLPTTKSMGEATLKRLLLMLVNFVIFILKKGVGDLCLPTCASDVVTDPPPKVS